MLKPILHRFCFVLALCLQFAGLAHGHVVLTYPGWRGNNLISDDSFPFGMQWMYPCGGLPVTSNRTHWPIGGGAIALDPGWFTGHDSALMYINIGLGEQPENYSWPITKFHLDGPTDGPYPGTVCLPHLTLPDDVRSRVKSGDLATIQVVQAAKHGAGLFTCADIIFTDDGDEVPDVNERNCFNSTSIKISDVAILGSQELPSACAGLGTTTGAAITGSGDAWGWGCETNGRAEFFGASGLTHSCPSSTATPTPTASVDENNAQSTRDKNGGMVIAAISLMSVVFMLLA